MGEVKCHLVRLLMTFDTALNILVLNIQNPVSQ